MMTKAKKEEIEKLIAKTIASGDKETAEIFKYRFLDQMNWEEIAAKIGATTKKTVKYGIFVFYHFWWVISMEYKKRSIKVTKSELLKILTKQNRLESKIKMLDFEIERLYQSLYPQSIRYDTEKVKSSPESKLEPKMALIIDKKEQKEKLKKEYLQAYKKSEELIDKVSDDNARMILRLKFLNNMDWKEIVSEVELSRRNIFYFYKKGIDLVRNM